MVEFFRFFFVSLVFTLGATITGHAASFDCSKATTATEIAICNDPDLSALDDLMGKMYSQALSYNDWRYFEEDRDDSELINSQRLAITSQIKCGQNKDCLLKFYRTRIVEIASQTGLNLETFGGDPIASLLMFSSKITSQNSIRDLATSNDGSVTVLMLSEGDPENISRANTGTVYDSNQIDLVVTQTNFDGEPIYQVFGLQAPAIALGATLDVENSKFIINEEHTRGFSMIEYERSGNGQWELSYASDRQVSRPAFGLITDYQTDYSAGVSYVTYSYIFLDCGIVEQPTLVGDNGRAYDLPDYYSFIDEGNTSEMVANNINLNDTLNKLEERDLREFSVYAFFVSDFAMARQGFELLASRNYPQSQKDLQCVEAALSQHSQ